MSALDPSRSSIPATAASSVSLNLKKSMAKRADSGKGDLCDGGVGRDAEGAGEATRAASDKELGPSANCCARMKQAAAMICAGYRIHRGVRNLGV